MYKDGDDPDDAVTINVENTEIRCNRKKLSECSRYFDVLLNGNFRESHEKTVKIQDVKSSVFEVILNYVEGAHSVGKDDLLDVLEVASMLQIEDLREYCVGRLTDGLSVATCLQVWQMCERLNVQPLAIKAKCKALLEFNVIKDYNNITSLCLEELHSYLANTSLHCENELDVFKCGMKWWHERSKNGQSASNANNCLITVLNCLDYEGISCDDIEIMKDVAGNSFVSDVLDSFLGDAATVPADVRAAINTLKQDRKRRDPEILLCVMSMDEDEHFNISFYDKNQKAMRKFINVHLHDNERSHKLLKHGRVLSYKENLLCFGQTEQDTEDINEQITSVWMYNTFKKQWQHVTRFPQKRTISNSCILNDQLFIIGISDSDSVIEDMMYYDFSKDEWTTDIMLPHSGVEFTCCEFQKQLFFMFNCGSADLLIGYFYIPETSSWQRVDVQDKNGFITQAWFKFSMFSDENWLYIQALCFTIETCLIELELVQGVLEVKGWAEFQQLRSAECQFFKSGRYLYIFLSAYDERFNYNDNNILLRYCLTDKTTDQLFTDKLYEVNWMPEVAFFGLFHYSIVSRDTYVSKFAY